MRLFILSFVGTCTWWTINQFPHNGQLNRNLRAGGQALVVSKGPEEILIFRYSWRPPGFKNGFFSLFLGLVLLPCSVLFLLCLSPPVTFPCVLALVSTPWPCTSSASAGLWALEGELCEGVIDPYLLWPCPLCMLWISLMLRDLAVCRCTLKIFR